MPFRQMTVPVANDIKTKKPTQIELSVPTDPEKGIRRDEPLVRRGDPLVFSQVHFHPQVNVHPTSPATHLTFIQRTTSRFHDCSSSPWLCIGLFGFFFVLLLFGMSNSKDCVSSDSWLFCDNHPLDHSGVHSDDHNHYVFPLLVFIFIGSFFACFWFSDRHCSNL